MKLSAKFFCTALVAASLFYNVPLQAKDPSPGISILVKKAKWAGVWDYTVQDVSPEYSKGVLHISKKRKEHTVRVELQSGTLDTENVMLKKNELSFSVSIEGQIIDVSLTLEGDTFSGQSSSPDGVFQLQGTRRD